jgi:uncharacterized membrane protein YfcA
VDLRRLRLGEWMTGAFGALLLVATFLPWYERPMQCVRAPCPARPVSAWEAFAVIDFVVVLAALFGIAAWVVTAVYRAPAVPMVVASMTTIVGIVGVALVVVRVALPPDAQERLGGLWLGLAGILGVAVGAWVAVRDEGYGFWPTQDPKQPAWASRVEITDLPAPPPDAPSPDTEAPAR